MQKLAVALTTQEELDQYDKYSEKMWWVRASGKNNWVIRERRPIYASLHDDAIRSTTKESFEWYKIISPQEAIGEKENKEIIREGEARVFEPKTEILLIKSFADFPVWKYIIEKDIEDPHCGYYVNGLTWRPPHRDAIHPDIVQWMKEYFEPIEEPKRDWIDRVNDEFFTWPWSYMESTEEDKATMREAIEKHMPKLKVKDVVNFCKEFKNWEKTWSLEDTIINLLKSKWLLE